MHVLLRTLSAVAEFVAFLTALWCCGLEKRYVFCAVEGTTYTSGTYGFWRVCWTGFGVIGLSTTVPPNDNPGETTDPHRSGRDNEQGMASL